MQDCCVLSDVHLDKVIENSEEYQFTSFSFHVRPETLHKKSNIEKKNTSCDRDQQQLVFDEDGDLIVQRNVSDCSEIGIFHKMSTNLSHVGFQVWRGALLMCDFIIHNEELFLEKRVLELGSGVGLTGIVAGQYAESIICTDVEDEIIDLCKRNMMNNARYFRNKNSFSAVTLDWFKPVERAVEVFKVSLPNVVLVCDCIYDNNITDALFKTINCLLISLKCQYLPSDDVTMYISLEKRLNFTLHDLEVTCHEYYHFRKCLSDLELTNKFLIKKLDVHNLTQSFQYDRVEQLELWQIKTI